MSADLCFTRDSFFLSFFLLFFVSYPRTARSWLNGTQPYSATWPKVSVIWKCVFEMWGISSPYKSAAQKPPFPRFRNLTATLMAYTLGTKHDTHKRASALQTTWGLLHRLKTTWTLVHEGIKLGVSFRPPSVNAAFHFIARLPRPRSAHGTQPNFARECIVNRANNLPKKSWDRISRKKSGTKNFCICSVFRRLRDLMANIYETWHRQSGKGVGKYKGSHELWSTNSLRRDRSFTNPHYFVLSQSIAHPLCGINMAPHSDSMKRHWVRLQLRFDAPKDVKLEMLSRR